MDNASLEVGTSYVNEAAASLLVVVDAATAGAGAIDAADAGDGAGNAHELENANSVVLSCAAHILTHAACAPAQIS